MTTQIKKITLLLSTVITSALTAIGIFGNYRLCYENQECVDILHSFFIHAIPVAPFFIFCLVTYWMRNEVYETWFRFARWWIPLSMLLIIISPEYQSDFMDPLFKGSVAIITSAIFVIVSAIIIVYKLVQRKKIQ